MKNLLFLSVVALNLLLPVSHAFFLGPIAVGLGVGALVLAKGFILGAVLSGNRSRSRQYRTRRSTYNSGRHYDTGYNSYYYQPDNSYYYSSNKYHCHRGKRSAELEEELSRARREVSNFNEDDHFLDLSRKDQDDCGKKLICELSEKHSKNPGSLTAHGKAIAERFSAGVDVTKGEVEFVLAAQVGKTFGAARCREMYKRCETATDDMLAMIAKEMEEINVIQLQEQGLSQADIDAQLAEEKQELEKQILEAGVNPDLVWSS